MPLLFQIRFIKMKNLLRTGIFVALFAFFACNDEPKLDKQEEQAIDQQINLDQKSMDSLEAAIMAQMEALDSDSLMKDSIE
jgi:hypothetical protein